jgi:opacity protein-like surface antigen
MRYSQRGERGMTRFAVATITLTVLISSFALAQDTTPKVQAFAGYSLVQLVHGGPTITNLDVDLHQITDAFGTANTFNGWSAEGQYNVDRWLGFAADIGGRSGTLLTGQPAISGMPTGNTYSFLAGPVLSYHTKSRVTPFLHVLAGWERTSQGSSTITGPSAPVPAAATTYHDFAYALGGGVDYKVSRLFVVRVGQLDYYHASLNQDKYYQSAFGVLIQGNPPTQVNLRFSAGVVMRF